MVYNAELGAVTCHWLLWLCSWVHFSTWMLQLWRWRRTLEQRNLQQQRTLPDRRTVRQRPRCFHPTPDFGGQTAVGKGPPCLRDACPAAKCLSSRPALGHMPGSKCLRLSLPGIGAHAQQQMPQFPPRHWGTCPAANASDSVAARHWDTCPAANASVPARHWGTCPAAKCLRLSCLALGHMPSSKCLRPALGAHARQQMPQTQLPPGIGAHARQQMPQTQLPGIGAHAQHRMPPPRHWGTCPAANALRLSCRLALGHMPSSKCLRLSCPALGHHSQQQNVWFGTRFWHACLSADARQCSS